MSGWEYTGLGLRSLLATFLFAGALTALFVGIGQVFIGEPTDPWIIVVLYVAILSQTKLRLAGD